MSERLKPCPFCGNQKNCLPHAFIDMDCRWEATVHCGNCRADGPDKTGATQNEAITRAIAAWNKREPEDE